MEQIPSNKMPKIDNEVIKQRILNENIPNLLEKLQTCKTLLSEFDSGSDLETKYEIAKKIRQVGVFDHLLAKRLIRVEEVEIAREYAGIEVSNAIRILSSLVSVIKEALSDSISDENKQKLFREIENGIDHYLNNSMESYFSFAVEDDSSLIKSAFLLQAQGREITEQYAKAALFYKITDPEEFKEKIEEMEEKSTKLEKYETYTAPSVDEQWEKTLHLHEIVKTFLDDVRVNPIVQTDPLVTMQKIIDYSKS